MEAFVLEMGDSNERGLLKNPLGLLGNYLFLYGGFCFGDGARSIF
jgi:hypothetical protein